MTSAIDALKGTASVKGESEGLENLRYLLWAWIDANGDQTVSLKIWIFPIRVKIRDLHAVFSLLLGTPPAAMNI